MAGVCDTLLSCSHPCDAMRRAVVYHAVRPERVVRFSVPAVQAACMHPRAVVKHAIHLKHLGTPISTLVPRLIVQCSCPQASLQQPPISATALHVCVLVSDLLSFPKKCVHACPLNTLLI